MLFGTSKLSNASDNECKDYGHRHEGSMREGSSQGMTGTRARARVLYVDVGEVYAFLSFLCHFGLFASPYHPGSRGERPDSRRAFRPSPPPLTPNPPPCSPWKSWRRSSSPPFLVIDPLLLARPSPVSRLPCMRYWGDITLAHATRRHA